MTSSRRCRLITPPIASREAIKIKSNNYRSLITSNEGVQQDNGEVGASNFSFKAIIEIIERREESILSTVGKNLCSFL